MRFIKGLSHETINLLPFAKMYSWWQIAVFIEFWYHFLTLIPQINCPSLYLTIVIPIGPEKIISTDVQPETKFTKSLIANIKQII